MNKLFFLIVLCFFVTKIESAKRRLLGGRTPQDLSNQKVYEKAVELAQFALDTRTDLDQTAYVLSEITSYSSQLVNGRNHFLSLRIFDNYNDFDYPANVYIYQAFRGPSRLVSFVRLVPRRVTVPQE